MLPNVSVFSTRIEVLQRSLIGISSWKKSCFSILHTNRGSSADADHSSISRTRIRFSILHTNRGSSAICKAEEDFSTLRVSVFSTRIEVLQPPSTLDDSTTPFMFQYSPHESRFFSQASKETEPVEAGESFSILHTNRGSSAKRRFFAQLRGKV